MQTAQGEDSKGSVIKANTQKCRVAGGAHSKVPRCRRGKLKSAALQERRGWQGLVLSWLCVRVPHSCTRLGFLIGHANEGAPLEDGKIRRALSYPGCAQGHMKVPHSVQGERFKGFNPLSSFREKGSGFMLCCLVVLEFSANLGEGLYIVVFDAIKLAIVLRSAFNPRLV